MLAHLARRISRLGIVIRQIVAGFCHSAALDQHGNVYTWGWGEHGQLGMLGILFLYFLFVALLV
jgi:alpha-tubulin suppressor-like RCC1 family protein